MRKTLLTAFVGCSIGLFGGTYYQQYLSSSLKDSVDHEVIRNYVNEHRLTVSNKVSIFRAFSAYSKSFVDHGLLQRLNGFSFFEVYFRPQELNSERINNIYCIFSPKEEVCGHPSIEHGGVTATIMDQMLGMLAMLHTRKVVATAELSCKYKAPVRKGELYILEGQVQRREGRKVFITSCIYDLQTKKKVFEGETLFMTVQWEHRMAEVFRMLVGEASSSETYNIADESIAPDTPSSAGHSAKESL